MKKYSLLTLFVLLALYTLFQARFLIIGPRINVESPQDNALVDSGVLTVKGTTENVAALSLDENKIYTDTTGHFEEKLVVRAGINIIKLEAKDRFGRETQKLIRVVAN